MKFVVIRHYAGDTKDCLLITDKYWEAVGRAYCEVWDELHDDDCSEYESRKLIYDFYNDPANFDYWYWAIEDSDYKPEMYFEIWVYKYREHTNG